MAWKTLTDLLAREFQNLRRMPLVTFGYASAPISDPQELKREELELAPRVDQIVRVYIRTKRWPALDEKERFFLRERIRFAYEYASIAEISIARPVFMTKKSGTKSEHRRVLDFLLVEVWRNSGVGIWLEPFFIMANPQVAPAAPWHLHISE